MAYTFIHGLFMSNLWVSQDGYFPEGGGGGGTLTLTQKYGGGWGGGQGRI